MTLTLPPRNVWFAALLSGALFYAAASEAVVGVLVLFLPLLPLFWTALRYGAYAMMVAHVVAFAIALLLTGTANATLMLAFLILPSWLFCWQLLKARLVTGAGLDWMPAGQAFVPVMLYYAILFAVIAFYAGEGGTPLPTLMLADIRQMTATMDPEMKRALEEAFTRFSHFFFAGVAWLLSLLIYATAVLANFICISYGHALRKHLALGPFTPPRWLLLALLATGVAGVAVSEENRFLWEAAFLMLLLPYFLSGLARAHELTRGWKHRGLWLTGLYLLLFLATWLPLVLLTVYGLLRQVANLLEGKAEENS